MKMHQFVKNCLIFLLLEFFNLCEQKAIYEVDSNDKSEEWLSDKENYDLMSDYMADAEDDGFSKDREKCPPLPEILSTSACMATPCFSDKECGDSEARCCDNGCVFTCLSYPVGPIYIDWVREPKSQQRNGISWLLKGRPFAEELEPCSTTRFKDEDPLMCPTGYICHVEKPGNSKNDMPNLGHCIPEKDVLIQNKTQTKLDGLCYLEDYLLADGASIKIQKQICYCKHGFLTCIET